MTKAEQEWCDAITAIGCIVCLLFFAAPRTPGAVHHMLTKGGRRIGHMATLCLCHPGHHKDAPKDSKKISRHPWKVRFENAYGTELELLEHSRRLVQQLKLRQAAYPWGGA